MAKSPRTALVPQSQFRQGDIRLDALGFEVLLRK